MFLITTADQRFWGDAKKVLFLGEWCKRFIHKESWEFKEHDKVPYHWNDRTRLYQDYLYIQKLYEDLLPVLVTQLNSIHQVDKPIRYWRILIGPWMTWFLETFYDRYLSIKKASNDYQISNVLLPSNDLLEVTPYSFNDYVQWSFEDEINTHLYAHIIKSLKPFNYTEIETPFLSRELRRESLKRSLLKKILHRTTLSGYYFFKPISLSNTYLSLDNLLKLSLKLKTVPLLQLPDLPYPSQIKASQKLRKNMRFNFKHPDEFTTILSTTLPYMIPICYLEDYKTSVSFVSKNYPTKSDVIMTAVDHLSNDAFMFWTADMTTRGTKLAVTQHGGHFGSGKWCSVDKHQIKIADRFFSWGWKARDNEGDVRPLDANKLCNISKKFQFKSDGYILMPLNSYPRYGYRMFSVPVSEQALECLYEQFAFYESLSDIIKSEIMLRSYSNSYRWDDRYRWQAVFQSVKFTNSSEHLYKQISNSKLVVWSHNTTIFLETFAANFPTILFWNPKLNELNSHSIPFYDELHKANILFYDPIKAAAHVTEIHKDPMKWWRTSVVQSAVKLFCKEFAFATPNWKESWSNELLELSKY